MVRTFAGSNKVTSGVVGHQPPPQAARRSSFQLLPRVWLFRTNTTVLVYEIVLLLIALVVSRVTIDGS
jgi:hypothetical protein